jgi:hypothetical protein
MSDETKKPEVLHVRKFDHANGGKRTPAEVHRQLGLGGRSCSFCGDPAAIRGMLYADAEEYARRDPTGYFALMQQCGGDPAFDSKWGKIVRVQDMYGCDRCKTSVKQYLAKKPDWMFADFDEMGLDSSHPTQVQVR